MSLTACSLNLNSRAFRTSAPRYECFTRRSSLNRSSESQRRTGRRAVCVCVAKNMEVSVAAEDGEPALKDVFSYPEGSKLFTASLRKPLGLTLVEKNGKVVVETVADEGNGKAAEIQVGDIVRATTARSKNVRTDEATSVEARNKQSFLGGLVLLRADGEDFDTVVAGIQSSKCSNCDVTLIMERPGR